MNPRDREIEKYRKAYTLPWYKMGPSRFESAIALLASLRVSKPSSYLDVACGRGEMLRAAEKLGYTPVKGTEIVPQLIGGQVVKAPVWDIPFENGSFDVVSSFDVLEHLVPGDDELAVKEMLRVSRRAVALAIAVRPHKIQVEGEVLDLHINLRQNEAWMDVLQKWCNPYPVIWRKDLWNGISSTFIVLKVLRDAEESQE